MTQRGNIFSFIFILAISLLLPINASAQKGKKSVNAVEADTLGLWRGMTVGFNVAGAAQRIMSSYGEYEASVRASLRDRFFPTVEVGIGSCNADDVTTLLRYKTTAPYFRLGCDFNVLKNKHDIYRLFVGGRLAYTNFKYDITSGPISDPVYGGQSQIGESGVGGSQAWYEAVGGVEAKIFGPVRLGWSVRYKGRVYHKDGSIGKPYYIPGFGRNGSTKLGATFDIRIEL